MGFIRGRYSNRTDAPQPLAIIAVIIWVIALICLFDGTNLLYAWCMVGVATLVTVYVALRFWLYFGARKAR
ncbi:MAG: hypothetical protein CXZ00_01020 [Acidobacteria bacterium]|nr:MAG: hypothetical protein CXZ00_01020 [Acidobacteriota bacterium]